MRVLVGNRLSALGIELDVAARIVIDRPAGLRIEALGPGQLLDGLGRLEELAVEPVKDVAEAVAGRVRDDSSVLAIDLGVDQDVAADLVIIVVVVGRILVVPGDLAVPRIEGDGAVGVEIVARTIARIVGRNRIARTP
jgi:hypothetical protein